MLPSSSFHQRLFADVFQLAAARTPLWHALWKGGKNECPLTGHTVRIVECVTLKLHCLSPPGSQHFHSLKVSNATGLLKKKKRFLLCSCLIYSLPWQRQINAAHFSIFAHVSCRGAWERREEAVEELVPPPAGKLYCALSCVLFTSKACSGLFAIRRWPSQFSGNYTKLNFKVKPTHQSKSTDLNHSSMYKSPFFIIIWLWP